MPSRPQIYYSSIDAAWVVRGRGGTLLHKFKDTDTGFGGIFGWVGSSPALAAIGTGSRATGTITGATGIAPGDAVFGVPKTAVTGDVVVAGFHVPTNNTLNFYVTNPLPNAQGSFAATGWDIFAFRRVS